MEHFSRVHSREGTVAGFHSCKYVPGENMKNYLAKLAGYAEWLGYKNNLASDKFWEGLPYDIHVQVTMDCCGTLEELMEAAEKDMDLTSSHEKRG